MFAMIITGSLAPLASIQIGRLLGLDDPLLYVVSATTGGGVVLLAMLLVRPRLRLKIRIALHREGLPICIHCGYDTTDLDDPRCPECGRPILNPPLF